MIPITSVGDQAAVITPIIVPRVAPIEGEDGSTLMPSVSSASEKVEFTSTTNVTVTSTMVEGSVVAQTKGDTSATEVEAGPPTQASQ